MDDSGFKSTRLSLIIISIGIIIYILGGGDIKDGQFLFGTIHFKDTDYVRYAVIIIYAYLFWRFWLYKEEIFGNFGDNFKDYFYRTDDYFNFVYNLIHESDHDKKVKHNFFNAIIKFKKKELHITSEKDKRTHRGITSQAYPTYHYPLMLDNHLFPSCLLSVVCQNYNSTSHDDFFKIPDKKDLIFNIGIMPINRIQFLSLELLAFIKIIVVRRDFADYLLPFMIALFAGAIMLKEVFFMSAM